MTDNLSPRESTALAWLTLIAQWALVLGILALAFWFVVLRPAHAQEFRCHYVTRSRPVYDTWSGTVTTHYYQIRQCHRNYRYYAPEERGPRVYAYERRRREGDEYGGPIDCRDPMRATGDDKLDQDKAEVSAQERWSLQVESRIGGLYSDVRFAANIRTTCVRRVPSSLTERGQATLGVRHYLCEVWARPCKAPAIRQDEDTRAKRRSERIEEELTPPAARKDGPR